MSVLQGSNIFAWIRAQLHLARLTSASRRQIVSISRPLRRATHTVGFLLALAYVICVFDIWLHLSGEAFAVMPQTTLSLSNTTLFGRQIDEARCETYSSVGSVTDGSALGDICALMFNNPASSEAFEEAYTDFQMAAASEGDLTFLNISSNNRVVFTDDQHAVMVPSSVPPSTTWKAGAIGVQTKCQR